MPKRRSHHARSGLLALFVLVTLLAFASLPRLAAAQQPDPAEGSPGDFSSSPFRDPRRDGGIAVTQQDGSIERDGRTIPYRFHLPAPSEPASTSYPVIVFLPGFQLSTDQYAVLAGHIASHGFIVVAADPPAGLINPSHLQMRDDALAVLDYALVALEEQADSGRIGAAGHSLGGKLATMMADSDPRIGALIGIDPVNGGGPFGYMETRPDIIPEAIENLPYAILMLGQTTDSDPNGCAPADQNFQTFYGAATSASWRTSIELVGADHVDFVDNPRGSGLFCERGSARKARVRRITRVFAVSYLQLALNGDSRYESYLLDPTRYGVAPGEVIVTHDSSSFN